MRGIDVYKKALILTESETEDKTVPKSAAFMINEIGKDLCDFTEIEDAFEEITAPKSVLDAMPYGIAMLISFVNGDTARHSVFCELYNAKRAAAKSSLSSVADTLPRAGEAI